MKKIILFMISVLFIFSISGCGKTTSTNTSSNSSAVKDSSAAKDKNETNKPKVTEVSLKTGSIKLYDFGSIKVHAYATHDAMGDESYLLENDKALVLLESPAFRDNLDEWSAYIKKIGKPIEGALLAYHPNGVKYYDGVTVYATQNAITNWGTGGATRALIDNFAKTFGDSFDTSLPSNPKVIKEGSTVTIGGIDFNILNAGDTAYSVEIPQIKSVFRHMMGSKSHNILTSTKHMDAMIAELKEYQKKEYTLVLSGHYEPESQDDVSTKIAYLEKSKELAGSCTTKVDFINAMKKAFPNYSGENYLEMTAGFLYK